MQSHHKHPNTLLWLLSLFALALLAYSLMRAEGKRIPKDTESTISSEFRGPTSAPYVKGPTSPPPGQ